MSRTRVSFRLPDSLITALKEKAELERISINDSLIDLLEQSLGLATKLSTIHSEQQLDSHIAKRVTESTQLLENRIVALELAIGKVHSLIQDQSANQAVVQQADPEKLPLEKLQARQDSRQPGKSNKIDRSRPSKTRWSIYLHHPRGTVERIDGPFPSEKQARSEMSSQMNYGLFPESKGYQWECREEETVTRGQQWPLSSGSGLDDPDDEPDEILYDFLEPEQPSAPGKSVVSRGERLTTGRAFEVAVNLGFKKSSRTFKRLLQDAIAIDKLPLELERLGLVADFLTRKQAKSKDHTVKWLRFKPGN